MRTTKRHPKEWSPREKAPLPKPGSNVRQKPPGAFDGIRFEIERLIQYIREGHKDPAAIAIAHKIAELAAGTARELGREVTEKNRDLIYLEGIHAWCRDRFEHVFNPAGAELIKSPARMLRELEIPEALSTAMWEPIRDSMAKAAKKDPAALRLPIPKVTGSSAVSTCFVLTLAAAVGITPLRMRFGGHDGTLHYMWGSAHAAGEWRDVDIMLPALGEHHPFGNYEDVGVPL